MYILLGFLALGIVVAWHEMAHLIAAVVLRAKVLAYAIGMGKTVASRTFFGIEWRLAILPIGGYVMYLPVWKTVDMSTLEDTVDLESHPDALPVWRQIVITAAGPIGSFILPMFCFTLLALQQGVPIIGLPLQINRLSESGAGAKAGLRVGDIISNEEIVAAAKAGPADASKLFAGSAGKQIVLQILRDGKNIDIPVQLASEPPLLGASVVYKYRPAGVVEATGIGIDRSVRLTKSIGGGTWDLLFGKSKSKLLEQISGPVGVIKDTSQIMSDGTPFLFVVGIISISIGFMNLIPIPALDGGQIVLLVLGRIFGLKRTSNIRSKAVTVSYAALALVFLYVTWNDIGKILR